jgi:outer membrane murein-binding lipoprotein Lpp
MLPAAAGGRKSNNMEEKLPKDGLEAFLKKSFEDYSESPSGDLWDKIEADLPPVAAPKFRFARRWWLGAAAVLILSVFTCQHFYFKNKISKLSRQVETTTTQLHQLQAKEQQLPADIKQPVPAAQHPAAKSTAPGTEQTAGVAPPNRNTAKPLPPATWPGSENAASAPAAERPIAAQPAESEPPLAEGPDSQPAMAQDDAVAAATPLNSGVLDLLNTPALQFLFAEMAPPVLHTAASVAPVIPPTKKGRFSLGFNVMPMAFQEKITTAMSGHPGGMMHFHNETRSSGQTIFAGVTADYGLDDRLSLLSGLNYRKNSFTSAHQPVFNFGNMMGGQSHHEYSVQYELSTSAGQVSVDLRAEQSDTTVQISAGEQIGLEIKTRQSQEYLSLPLGLRYRLGTGRFGWNVKGGIIANFLLSSDLGISEISSSNAMFMRWAGSVTNSGQEGLRSVALDYFAGIGLNYAIAKSWSLGLEPTVIGSLSNAQKDPNIRVSRYSVGLNAALLYTF